ncbi:DUF748 domain-containing protein [Vibrio sp.]|nr:DUF748 domain-containing protein [Vibrio sp.]
MIPIIKNGYARFKALPKLIRVLTYLLSTYALFLLIVGVLVPQIAQKQIPQQLNKITGRNVSIGEVRINPFLLRVTLNKFNILSQDGKSTFISFEQFQIEPLFWKSVFTLTPTLDYAVLKQPVVNVSSNIDSQGNTRFSFQDIVDHIAQNSAEEPKQPESQTSEPFAFIAHSIQLVDGEISYSDKNKNVDFNYPNLDLAVDNINIGTQEARSDQSGSHNDFSLALGGSDNKLLTINGAFQLYPLDINGKFAFNQFDLTNVWPYIKDYVNGKLTKGILSVSSKFNVVEHNENINITTNSGELSVKQLTLKSANDAPAIYLDTFDINKVSMNLEEKQVSIASLVLDKLQVYGNLNKNGVDLASLYREPKSKVTSNTTAKSQSAKSQTEQNTIGTKGDDDIWLIKLATFKLSNSKVSLTDNAIANNVKWSLDPINVQVNHIQSDFQKPLDYTLSVGLYDNVNQGSKNTVGTITSDGNVNIQEQNVSSNIAISNIDLSDLQPYISPYVNIDLKKGLFSTKGKLSTSFDATQLIYQGDLGIESLHINDKLENQPFLTWADMNIDSLSYDQKGNTLNIGTVTFNKPYAKVLIDKNRNTNINDILNTKEQKATKTNSSTKASAKETKTAQSETTKEAQSSLKIAVHKVLVKNGSAYFSDLSLTPNFSSGINSINGQIDKLTSSAETTANVNLKGKIDQYAPITIKGDINPLLASPFLDLTLDVKGAELTSINPYSGTYAGYYIDKGQMSLTLKYLLQNNQLNGSNHVYIDQLKLGEPSNSKVATSLPVKLAIALLQDRNGVIDLGVNVSGNVNDPSFGIGSVILTAVKNIIVKAVTAPFSLLANLIGSDEDLNIIKFAPGSSALSTEEQNRLDQLFKALQQRPKLKLSIAGYVSQTQDAQALAEIEVKNELKKLMGDEALPQTLTASQLPTEGDIIDALETLYENKVADDLSVLRDSIEQKLTRDMPDKEISSEDVEKRLHITMYNQIVNAVDVPLQSLGSLAHQRASEVKNYLVNTKGIDPQRIFLVNSRPTEDTDKSEVSIELDN